MDKNTLITIVVFIGILLLVGAYTFFVQQSARLSERDAEATSTLNASEDTPYTDLEGNEFTFDSFKGQVRVVNAWASWCPFCTAELPDFELLAQEFSEQDVAVIAINRKEPRERAVQFLDTVGTFTHTNFVVDLTDAYYISVGGFSMPETVFYDSQGNITFHKRGAMTLQEMREHTQNAINAIQQ